MAVKKPPPDNPDQSKRFVDTAKALDVDESGKAFARAFKVVVPKKKAIKRRRKAAV